MTFHAPSSSRRNNQLRAALYRAQRGYCGICGKRLKNLVRVTVDHVWPRGLGGANAKNRVAAHPRCNAEKGSRPPTGCEIIFLDATNARLVS